MTGVRASFSAFLFFLSVLSDGEGRVLTGKSCASYRVLALGPLANEETRFSRVDCTASPDWTNAF